MRSPSLEYLYAKLEKQIKLTEAYSEIKGLAFIIKACRLKPYNYIFHKRDNRIILHRMWFDEYGNSFNINNKKIIDIIYNDLNIDKDKIVNTDIYYGLSLEQVAKMSKLVYIISGKDEDLFQECLFLTFLGIDDHLRSYIMLYNEWQQVSPLLLGLKNLKYIAEHLDIKYFQENKENSILPCIDGQAVLSYVPVSIGFTDLIKKQYEYILHLFEKL